MKWRRFIELTAAAVGFVVALPLLILLCAAIRVFLGKPVLFRQIRAGQHGQPFTFYKLRTMTGERDSTGKLLPDHARLTRLGRFLRATSLDELPQLWNVLKGDMSLIGPRPLLAEYLTRYSPEQMRRHEVKPGITGLAQVMGRNTLSWEEKFRLDVWYVDHQSFWLDFRILALTALRLFRPSGISAGSSVTMPEFQGTTPQRSQP